MIRHRIIGHRIHGDGPRHAIFLHGWFGDHRIYEPLMPAFDPSQWCCAFVDQRGYGLSREREGPYNLSTLAADVIALADHLGWEGFDLVGHSMGGKAALRVALDAPGRVGALVALTPVWAGAPLFDAETFAMFRSAATRVEARDGIIRHSTAGRLSDKKYAALVQDSFEAATTEAFAAYFESWAGEDFSAEAPKISIPVTVIVGEHDLAITPEMVEQTWLCELQHVSMRVLGGSGHYPMKETPEALGKLMLAALEQER